MQPLSQPPNDFGPRMVEWLRRLWLRINETGSLDWDVVSKAGSNLTDLETRNHEDLQNINTETYTHLSATDHTDLTDGGDSILHYHAADRDSANFTGTNWTALTDAGATTLHKHAHGGLDDIGTNTHAQIDAHIGSTSNPHSVTAAQVGADPIGTAAAAISSHIGDADPHTQYILDTDIGVTVQAYDADIATVSASQAEMEAGTETALRSMSPLRVAQAIAALAPSGSGSTILHKNPASITTNQSLAAGENGSITTPITLSAGVTLTLATGSRLVLL